MTDEKKELEDAAGENPPAEEARESAGKVRLNFEATELGSRREDKSGSEREDVSGKERIAEKTEEPVSAAAEGPSAAETAVGEEAKPEAVEEDVQAVTESKDGKTQVDYSRTFRTLSSGDVVEGVVVHIDKEGVLVDVGTKSEGVIRPGELSPGPVQRAEDVVSVGDKIDVYVIQPEGEDGNLVLSKKRADFENAWTRVEQAHKDGKVLTAMVTDRVKGGLVVDLGVRGFVPGSHVGSGKVRNLERYVGQSLPLRVIEVDRQRRKVVLSHRLAVEEDRTKRREKTIASLVEGQIRDGVVRRITDYGAFVDLGGIDGLLHISEMSWARVNHPSDVVKVGQKIQVMILRLNPEAGRVSLGLRQILPDPWVDVSRRYSVGDVVRGTVSRLVPFGAFVQLDGDIEGIVPNAELSQRRVSRPDDVVSVDESVEVKIIDMRPEERRMTLSIRRVGEEKDHREYQAYQSSKSDGRMTLGDLVGEKLQALAAAHSAAEAEEEAQESAEPEAEVQEPAQPAGAEEAEEAAAAEQEAVVSDIESAGAVEEEQASEAEAPVEPEESAEDKGPGEEPVAEKPRKSTRTKAKASKAKTSKAKTSKAKTSKAKTSKAKTTKAETSKPKTSKAKASEPEAEEQAS